MTTPILANRFQKRVLSARRGRLMSEINVTPFVDVMLVLLVIFMVTAPLLTVGVPIDLPQTKANALPGSDEPLSVSIDIEGRVWVMDTEVPFEGLATLLTEISGANKEVRIFVRGDRAINYGRVLEVMGAITAAGFNRVALVSRSTPPGISLEEKDKRN